MQGYITSASTESAKIAKRSFGVEGDSFLAYLMTFQLSRFTIFVLPQICRVPRGVSGLRGTLQTPQQKERAVLSSSEELLIFQEHRRDNNRLIFYNTGILDLFYLFIHRQVLPLHDRRERYHKQGTY